MRDLAVGAIVAKNYVSQARTLARSFRRHVPETPFYVLLTDDVDGRFVPEREPFELLLTGDMEIIDRHELRFRYSRQQLAVAAKPHLLQFLLDRGFRSAVLMDPDVLVLGDLVPLFAEVRRHSVSLTPHLCRPANADRELSVLRSGVFNGGFVAVSESPSARRFLAWWRDRLREHCRHDISGGVYFDQRWLDLAFTLFDDVHVVRDAGCNVAYWNLSERDVRIDGDRVTVNGRPCRFFHFSGFDPQRPDLATRHSPGLAVADLGSAATLYLRYQNLLEEAGCHETRTWPYAFDRFKNGVEIPEIARRVFAELGSSASRFGDPAEAGAGSYFEWLNESVDDERDPARLVSRLWKAVYDIRPDVQRRFPNLFGADREGFLAWTAKSGLREHAISERFMMPGRHVPDASSS